MARQRKSSEAGVRNGATRRSLLAAPAVLMLPACAGTPTRTPSPVLPGTDFATPAGLVVETDKGKVRGYVSGGIRTFKGIPYGADTSGAGRFRPPVAPEAWSGVRDAFSYGAACPQVAPGPAGRIDFLMARQSGHTSEDCLNLNVWTPGMDGAKRPVMVWIHGGNYSTGSSYASRSQDGEALARRGDVVVVTVNHRLNILGHLDLAAVGGPVEYASSVNVGLLDLVRALEWVRDNIAAFGGDAGNVLLFGHSGGGLKITHLSGMPSARGLFHKAVVQSGSQVEVFDETFTEGLAQRALEALSVAPGDISALQSVPVEALQMASQASLRAWHAMAGAGNIWRMVGWAPRIEASSVPWHPYSREGAAVSRDIALMAGSTLHEFNPALFNPAMEDMTREALTSSLAALYSEPETIVSLAEKLYPGQKPVALSAIISAAAFNRTNVVRQCQAKAALGGAGAYLYQFAWETPVLDATPRAYHGAELPFVFANSAREVQATGDVGLAGPIEAQLCDAWTAFAHTGRPHHTGLPKWDAVAPVAAPTMVFDTEPGLEAWRDRSLMEAVAQLRI